MTAAPEVTTTDGAAKNSGKPAAGVAAAAVMCLIEGSYPSGGHSWRCGHGTAFTSRSAVRRQRSRHARRARSALRRFALSGI
jgi:hypothetical protein